MAQLGSALDWGSRGRRFKSCRPDHIVAGRRGFRRLLRSPFWIFGSQTGSQLAFRLRGGGGLPRAGLRGFEDLVHGGRGCGECWADFVAVDRFGDGGAAVAHQVADVLDPEAAVVATGREQCSNSANASACEADRSSFCPRRGLSLLLSTHHVVASYNRTGCLIMAFRATGVMTSQVTVIRPGPHSHLG